MAVVAASLGIGIYLSSRLSERIRVLGKYITLLEEASVKMTYTSANLAALFADNFAGYPFSEKEPFSEQFRAMTQLYADALKREDIRLLDDFTRDLGASDTASQLQHLQLYIGLLRERLDDAREEERRKGRLCMTVPLSAGITAAILLI